MNIARISHLLFTAIALPLLAAPIPASGAPARKVAPPVRPDNSIIPLPLNPVIPPALRRCTTRTLSGLGYTMLRPATGARPAGGDLVLVNYIGYLAASGVVFDQGMRSALRVDGVIPGFSEGLQMLAKTGIARLCIPAAMGYGTQGTGPIPANADLVFQVELVDYRAGTEGTPEPQAVEPEASKDAAPRP